MYVSTHVCMYVCTYVMYVRTYVCTYVCVQVNTCVITNVRTYVCVCVCTALCLSHQHPSTPPPPKGPTGSTRINFTSTLISFRAILARKDERRDRVPKPVALNTSGRAVWALLAVTVRTLMVWRAVWPSGRLTECQGRQQNRQRPGCAGAPRAGWLLLTKMHHFENVGVAGGDADWIYVSQNEVHIAARQWISSSIKR